MIIVNLFLTFLLEVSFFDLRLFNYQYFNKINQFQLELHQNIDFKNYFKLLKQYKINVPVTLHTEYPLGGAEHGAKEITCNKQVVFNAMKKDLQKVRELWQQS